MAILAAGLAPEPQRDLLDAGESGHRVDDRGGPVEVRLAAEELDRRRVALDRDCAEAGLRLDGVEKAVRALVGRRSDADFEHGLMLLRYASPPLAFYRHENRSDLAVGGFVVEPMLRSYLALLVALV